MLDWKRAPHTEENYRQLTDDGHEFLADKYAARKNGEIRAEKFRVQYPSSNETVRLALDDLEQFYSKALKRTFQSENGHSSVVFRVIFPEKEIRSGKYEIRVSEQGVEIQADSPRGAARALFRIENRLRLRRAPFLPKGTFDNASALDPSLTYPAFKSDSMEEFSYPEAYHENYLKRIVRAGYTGFHLNIGLRIFQHSKRLQELDCPEAEVHLETLRKIIHEAGRFGLEVYLSLYLEPLSVEHPVFKRLPEIMGSRMVGADSLCVLCSSHPLVRRYYREQFDLLFRKAPGLAGVLLISGCEGFLHCHTACGQTPDNLCNCPRCSRLCPEKSVAEMFNAVAKSIKAADRTARCIIWNYGIFAWSDIQARKFISFLSKDCEVMANFDTGSDYRLEGVSGTYFDYSLTCVGPSVPFQSQSRAASIRGIPMHAKTESGASLEYYSLQYFPSLIRWSRKFGNLAASGVSGALFNWKFIGYTEGLSQELAGLMGAGEDKGILERLVERDFGRDNVTLLRKAWRCFDRAIDFHPFSIGTSGYFKGPFYIGPAQPLFPTTEPPVDLPECFWREKGKKCPMFHTGLEFVEPFGVKACLRALRKLEKHWSDGCSLLAGLHPHDDDPYLKKKIVSHVALCRLAFCFIRTALHMTDFYRLRDSMKWEPCSIEQARKNLEKMSAIARLELDNTKEALSLIQKDHRISFSYTYRYGISEEMCLYKIAHTEKLLAHDIPVRYYCITFNRNRHPLWLFPENSSTTERKHTNDEKK